MSQQRQDNEVVETGGSEESPERYHRYKKSLGKGAYKTVFEAFDTEHGNLVAWNQVDRGNLVGKKYDDFLNEVLTLKKLNHPAIIKLTEWWECDDKVHVVFITELMTSGDLKKYISQRKVNLKMTRKWARQILQALDYLHTAFDFPIVHRDIKCDNIFINGNLGEVKLGDLGLSTMMTQTHAASVLGTPEFMAPEMYGESYNEKVDIYAFGMCILEIFTGQYPYEECQNTGQIFRKVNAGIPPKALIQMENIAVKHFIESCLSKERERPTAKQLLQHELLIDLLEAEPVPQPAAPNPNPNPSPSTPTLQTLDSAQGVTSDSLALPNTVPPLVSVVAGGGGHLGTAVSINAQTQRVSDGTVLAADAHGSAVAPDAHVATTATTATTSSTPLTIAVDGGVKLNNKSPAVHSPKISIIDTSMQKQQGGGESDLSVIINAQIDGKQKKIQFDFNTQEDSADEVAADLVEELMENQASALLPQTSEEREVFVSDVKKLFTSSIEDAVDKLSANPLAPSSGHTSTVQLSQPISVAHVSPPPEHPAPAPSPAVPGADASAVSVERDVVPPATQAPLSAGASLPQILPTPPVPPLPAPSATAPKVAAGTTSEGGLPIVPLSLLRAASTEPAPPEAQPPGALPSGGVAGAAIPVQTAQVFVPTAALPRPAVSVTAATEQPALGNGALAHPAAQPAAQLAVQAAAHAAAQASAHVTAQVVAQAVGVPHSTEAPPLSPPPGVHSWAAKAASSGAGSSDGKRQSLHSSASSNPASVAAASIKTEVAAGVHTTGVDTRGVYTTEAKLQAQGGTASVEHVNQTPHDASSQIAAQVPAATPSAATAPAPPNTNSEAPAWYTDGREKLRKLMEDHDKQLEELEQRLVAHRRSDEVGAGSCVAAAAVPAAVLPASSPPS